MYSDLYLKSPSKPPAILFVVAIIAVLGFFVSFTRLPSAPTRASKIKAANHTIVNIAPREAGIFWETADKTTSWVVWGEREGALTATTLDERDLQDSRSPSHYHFIHLQNLKENTTYFYKLVSNNELITAADGKSFQLTTSPNIPPLASVDPVYGNVIVPSGEAAANTLVKLSYPGAYPLMTLVKIDGGWLMPVPYLIDRQTNKLLTPDKKTPITLELYLDDYKKTTIQTTLAGAAPLSQTIIIGTDYTLTNTDNVLPASTGEAQLAPKSTDILFPKEKAIVPGRNPLIRGIAAPNADVSIKINTKPATSLNLQANARGEWVVNQPLTISAGSYQITVTTYDQQQKLVTLRRSFSIAKSGEQVLAAASGPATLTPTPTTALLPTATTSPLTPTSQPTYAVTTSTPTPPVTGLNPIYFLGGSILLILLGAGMMVLL